jgi:hypothetical protein
MFTVSENAQFQIMEGSVLQLNKANIVNDNAVGEFSYEKYAIAPGATNIQLNFARIATAKYIYLVSDQDISVKLNLNTNTAIGPLKFMMLNITSVTAIYISNAGAQIANLDVVLAGV